MSSKHIVSVEHLSKCYQIYENPHDRLKQFLLPSLARLAGAAQRNYFREFWAVNDVSFYIGRGETVGILGRNGSGKSTLLQMICGTLAPTMGTIQTSGRVAALLELGSGFSPEFTGRENIMLNASVLGVPEDEALERMGDVIEFSGLSDYVDQPKKTY